MSYYCHLHDNSPKHDIKLLVANLYKIRKREKSTPPFLTGQITYGQNSQGGIIKNNHITDTTFSLLLKEKYCFENQKRDSKHRTPSLDDPHGLLQSFVQAFVARLCLASEHR